MYRFIFSLLAIADELWIAQNSRCGYRTWNRGMHSLGILIGQLLQRTLENYRHVSLSLASLVALMENCEFGILTLINLREDIH